MNLNMKTVFTFITACCFSTCFTVSLPAQEGKNLMPLFEKYGIDIKDQGTRGTCSVFALVGVLEFEYAHTRNQATPLSVEYLNWASNKITGIIKDGSFFDAALDGLLKYGICSNEYFPYYFTNYSKKVEPSEAAILDAETRKNAELFWIKEWDPSNGINEVQLAKVKEMIDAEHPVAIGFQWPKKEEQYQKMINGMMYVPPREGVYDGHSVIVIGYQDEASAPGGGYFIIKNSFGKNWGDMGYGKMPYEYAANYANDVVAVILNQ